MGNRVTFILGFHSHQPVGNFDHVFEENFQKSYWPFLEVLSKHPKIRIALHYTGILYQWLNEHHPELNDCLKEMVARNQIELMTGGYFEPILSVIPDQDKQGQIKKLTDYVKKNTGYDPVGLWLAERVWEPQLASHLADAGIKYTVTDDSHFRSAGLQEEDTWGYYLTEDAGKTLAIFPISERLRYLIPFQKVENTIAFFKQVQERGGNPVIVMADDLEKFGSWPGTYEHCYEKKWLEQFFTIIEDNLDWINLITFKECLAQVKPVGRIYLPTASYAEMMEWAMPTKAILKYEDFLHTLKDSHLYNENKPFVRGGFWRNFLVKYPESNNIHKKMLHVSRKVNALKKVPAKKMEEIKNHLYAGQTNCGYWHGLFGGLYLNYLRFALYRNLIIAENMADEINHRNNPYIEHEIRDFDGDGNEEILINSDKLNCYFKPSLGACLFEEDIKEKEFNLLDTLSRKPEAYHEKLKHGHVTVGPLPKNEDTAVSIHDLVMAKEVGLDQHLNYDQNLKYSFIDHFYSLDTSLENVYKVTCYEAGDFFNQPYESKISEKNSAIQLAFERKGQLTFTGGIFPLDLKKIITLKKDSHLLKADYKITNTGLQPVAFIFGIEFNFALLAGNADDRYYYIPEMILQQKNLASLGENHDIPEIGLKDHWLKVDCNLKFSVPADIWRYPVETVSNSEAGYERVYQCSTVIPHWRIELQPGASWSATIQKDTRHFK